MSYVRFVPGFSRHPKRLRSGPVSSWLWACSVDYCAEHLTDGFLPLEAVPTLCSNVVGSALKRATENLLDVGSWTKVPGGYQVHDYLRHNQSKSQVESDREASRKRYNAFVERLRSNAVTNAVANAVEKAPNAVTNAVTNAVGEPSNAVNNAVTNAALGRSVGRLYELPTTSKGNVSRDTGSDTDSDPDSNRHPDLPTPRDRAEHRERQDRARELLRRAGLKPPSQEPDAR